MRCFMKLPPEISCPRWSHLQKGQWGNVCLQPCKARSLSPNSWFQWVQQAQEWVTWHCALVSHLLHRKPSPNLLVFLYTTLLDSKECKRFNAVSDGLNSLWKWLIYKEREPQQNSSNKLKRDSYILNWCTGFCSKRLTISLVYTTPYSSLGQIQINQLILVELKHQLRIWHSSNKLFEDKQMHVCA